MNRRFKNHMFEANSRTYRSWYINRFMSMKAAPDFLSRHLFPNAKEITESFGAFEGTNHLDETIYAYNNKKVSVVCVGDGHTPRTAATFAFRSAWNCISIDPVLRNRNWNVHRLTTYAKRIEDIELSFDGPLLIVLVHAHVHVETCLKQLKAVDRAVIAMPCCNPHFIKDREPDVEYEDVNIWSPKNLIKVWQKV